MQNEDNRAINAVWKSESETHTEKLVLAHLATKHELGEKYSSSWKPLDQFIDDFQDRWCALHELADATQLSPLKVERTLAGLVARDLIKVSERPAKLGKRKKLAEGEAVPMEQVVALTTKIFNSYRKTLSGHRAETGTGSKLRTA